MTHSTRLSVVALAASLGWAVPAQAQDAAAVQAELAQMRAQMAAMAARIDTLEGQLSAAQGKADAASTQAQAATAALAKAPAPTVTARPATEVTWDGAPKLATASGFSFKPRGRLQLDSGSVSVPGLVSSEAGLATEMRRAFLGFDGTLPGGFGYRAEIDIAGSSVAITDLFLTYKASKELTLTLGQHKPFWGLEELTSDLMTSQMERAAFNTAFGFERRIGISGTYAKGPLLVQAGLFTDDAAALNADTDNSWSADARVVVAPQLAGGTLHLGGSFHTRQFNDLQSTARYSARPFVHTTDLRLVDTKAFSATGERSVGFEGAWIAGRFHAAAESHWLTALRPGLADPTFNGGYAEVGYLLTDDATVYKGGVFDRIRPKAPVGKGGIGAVQANLRYDWLDLDSGAIVGGRQQIAAASLLWIPTDYVRFILNYGHLWLDNAAVPAGTARRYEGNALGMRAQFDF